MAKHEKKTPQQLRIGGPGTETNDLALENLMDEFDMTAADLQDLEPLP